MSRTVYRWIAIGALLALSCGVIAAPRAWLDRDRVAQGDTVTLNIESETGDAPDFAALHGDFDLRGQSSRTETTIANGSVRTRTLWAVALEPRHAGVLTIPALGVGAERTEPLTLTVTPGQVGAQAQGQDVFLEVQVDPQTPYVGQPVMYTLRLSYAITLLDGDLDPPGADGVDVRRIGDDASYQRTVAGRRYQTLERRFVLIPERSGALVLNGARFRGRTLAGLRDPVFGGARAVSAIGEGVTLQVKPQPAQAQQPWLPATIAKLSMQAPTAGARVGEPVNVELTLHLQGTAAAQVPELQMPEVPGARVFPDVPQVRERVVDGVLTVDITRRFALVPSQAGELTVPAVRIPWWNTLTDSPQIAQTEPLPLPVAAGDADSDTGSVPPPAAVSAPEPSAASQAVASSTATANVARPWQWLSLMLLLGWLITLGWIWRRALAARRPVASPRDATRPRDPLNVLRNAAAQGDLAAADAALRDLRRSGRLDEGALEPSQRAALASLQVALWGDGDHEQARLLLRQAFADGLRTAPRASVARRDPVLPPLYPEH